MHPRAEQFFSLLKRMSKPLDGPDEQLEYPAFVCSVKTARVFRVRPEHYLDALGEAETSGGSLTPPMPELPASSCFIAIAGDHEGQDLYLADERTGEEWHVIGLVVSGNEQDFRAWLVSENGQTMICDALYTKQTWHRHADYASAIVPALIRRAASSVLN